LIKRYLGILKGYYSKAACHAFSFTSFSFLAENRSTLQDSRKREVVVLLRSSWVLTRGLLS